MVDKAVIVCDLASGNMEFKIAGCRIQNCLYRLWKSRVWNLKGQVVEFERVEWGTESETAGCRTGNSKAWNWKQRGYLSIRTSRGDLSQVAPMLS